MLLSRVEDGSDGCWLLVRPWSNASIKNGLLTEQEPDHADNSQSSGLQVFLALPDTGGACLTAFLTLNMLLGMLLAFLLAIAASG